MKNNIDKNIFIGLLCMLFHNIIIYITLFVVIFSNNFFILYSLGFIILIILFINYLYHDCPISSIEEYHLGFCSVDYENSILPINYDKNKRPEITLQWIFISLIIILSKILFLFLIKTFCKNSLIKTFFFI